MQDIVLATFLVIQHDLHSDFRAIGPSGMGRVWPVAA